jgi:hypothetical protein
MLGDYLFFCPTRVMASQVIDVTMETLLHIKVRSRIASRGALRLRVLKPKLLTVTPLILVLSHSSWCSTWCTSP